MQLQVGDSGIPILIDTLAGTSDEYVGSLETWTCSLKVTAVNKGPDGTIATVTIPPERPNGGGPGLTPNGDGRTFLWNQIASDTPYAGVYKIDVIAVSPEGMTRVSNVTTITVQPSA